MRGFGAEVSKLLKYRWEGRFFKYDETCCLRGHERLGRRTEQE